MRGSDEPRLEDVHTVLRLAFKVLGDSLGVDTLLFTLQVASGQTPCDSVTMPPGGQAASRFVLDALTDSLVDQLLTDLEAN
jgi:hypothetical protein